METLWAPWRIGYVTAAKPEGCIFCSKPGEDRDAENFILHRGRESYVILNIYPYNNGHLMIVPYAHTASIEELPAATLAEMMTLSQRAVAVLRETIRPTGFNMGINQGTPAGAGVADHVHLHIVPRWVGDTNFMSVLADARVLAQSLESCYALLHEPFGRAESPATP